MNRREALAALSPLALAGCLRFEGTTETRANGDGETLAAGTGTNTGTNRDTTTSREEPKTESATTTDSEGDGESTTENSTTEDSTTTEEGSGLTVLELAVDWSALADGIVEPGQTLFSDGFDASLDRRRASRITHVGAQLVDADGRLIAARSVERSTSRDVLQMIVDEASDATLNLAAVDARNGGTSTVALASVDDVTVEANARTRLDATAARWLRTEWYVLDEFDDTYESGTFTADVDAERFAIEYAATYPFSGQDLRYRDLLVTLQGIGGPIENTGDYHTYRIVARNPDPGTPSESTHTFQPVLASDDFALPTGSYPLPPEGSFTVSWE